MKKRMFYAICDPPSIVDNWVECESIVKGKKRARFKKFSNYHDAEDFIEDSIKESIIPSDRKDYFNIYVDGSYIEGTSKFAGWAFVVVLNGELFHKESGTTKEYAKSRQIDGECEAVIRAVDWFEDLDESNKVGAIIHHDYEGLAHWVTGAWKARSSVAKNYVEKLPYRRIEQLGIHFKPVDAHTGDKWNDKADHLAKNVLQS